MRRPTYNPSASYDEKIKRLERELDEARRDILALAPDRFRDLLKSYLQCQSHEETLRWDDRIAEEIAGHAEVLPATSEYSSDRGYCPLCGDSQSFYRKGFSLPEGLRRHLVGFGNVHQCSVMRAAVRLARQYWRDEFGEAEQVKKRGVDARTAKRLATETLYLVAPDLEPELIDARQAWWRGARSQEELEWAEERLASLGFTPRLDGRIKSYTREHDAFVVFSDPREKGRIQFAPYKRPLPKPGKSSRPRLPVMHAGFHVMDNWKHDIQQKYEKRLAEAIAKLK